MKNLLDKFTDQEILKRLFQLYPDQKKSKAGYVSALAELRVTKPKKSVGMKIRLRSIHDDIDPKNIEDYVSVDGYKRGSPTGWAIEYTPWSEWLGWKITKESFKNFSELDIMTYCLWEMTWSGYSSSEIKKVIDGLIKIKDEALKDIESGKVKGIPFKEFKKKLI